VDCAYSMEVAFVASKRIVIVMPLHWDIAARMGEAADVLKRPARTLPKAARIIARSTVGDAVAANQAVLVPPSADFHETCAFVTEVVSVASSTIARKWRSGGPNTVQPMVVVCVAKSSTVARLQ